MYICFVMYTAKGRSEKQISPTSDLKVPLISNRGGAHVVHFNALLFNFFNYINIHSCYLLFLVAAFHSVLFQTIFLCLDVTSLLLVVT